ncbi:type 2 lanthipeptide synthetase LanM [Chrysosporum bergii ANA360D]|uniref:Type 2 lanthipeptide synthetase LanM n=1 Tax=Chrysosporum bergii ANA360D TaxID=617107 RepID=A0AA43GRA7_9CYAN|nr:type 2 lanthipeptide synthetase LanM [Chrysosporum bergii]MDH6059583.1 type 2 lanthipeptide synthetase LanM [Chrysosporum bergii ANA360D]
MQLTNMDLITSIVRKAATLSERIDHSLVFPQQPLDTEQAEKRLASWCQIVSKGDSSKFERRLAWDGWELDKIRCCLDDIDHNQPETLPPWADTLNQLLQVAKTTNAEELFAPQPYLNPEEPIPFEHFYFPFVQVAWTQLNNSVGTHWQLLADSAQLPLQRNLVNRLATIAAVTLLEEFTQFRSSSNSTRDFLLLHLRGRYRQEKYQEFIKKLFADGLVAFFQEYSVLARLLAQTIDFWVESMAEFIHRLAADYPEIEKSFANHQPLGQVVDLAAGLSDPHNRGRSVISLTFEQGMQLIYKPKTLVLDVTFYRLIDWYNNHSVNLPLKVIKTLNRQTYGWVEYISFQDCQTQADAEKFYQRMGMLMCLVYVLEGTDCHLENLVAHAEHPVLIDLETLLQHRFKIFASLEESQLKITESVLRTAMLPTHMFPNAGIDLYPKNFDMSGIGGVHDQELDTLTLADINTDGMRLDQHRVAIKNVNSPTCQGNPIFPHDYLENILNGFEDMYRFLITYHQDLLTSESCLTDLNQQKVRLVFRNTSTYAKILQKSYCSMFLRCGIDHSIILELLSRAFLVGEEKPVFWPVLKAELQAMEQNDIPFFVVDSSSDGLILPNDTIVPEVFTAPSFQLMLQRLKTLNEANLTEQMDIIRKSLSSRFQLDLQATES